MTSLIVIAPVAVWPQIVALNAALGFDAGDGIALSADGAEPATHRGLHAWVSDAYLAIVSGETVPDGIAADDLATVLGTITTDATEGAPLVRFDALLASMGLQRIEDEA